MVTCGRKLITKLDKLIGKTIQSIETFGCLTEYVAIVFTDESGCILYNFNGQLVEKEKDYEIGLNEMKNASKFFSKVDILEEIKRLKLDEQKQAAFMLECKRKEYEKLKKKFENCEN